MRTCGEKHPFLEMKNRCKFRSYESLIKFYNIAIEAYEAKKDFFEL